MTTPLPAAYARDDSIGRPISRPTLELRRRQNEVDHGREQSVDARAARASAGPKKDATP